MTDEISMSDSKLFDFDDFCDLLMPLGALSSPSELHGFVLGKLAGGAHLDEADWLSAAREFLDLVGEPGAETREAIDQLYTISLEQLQAEDFGLELMLPDDDSDLSSRAQALGQWCHGFLSGFGSSGLEGSRQFSPSAAEALRDLAAIVQIGVDDDEEDEAVADDSEANFVAVAEYVRMAVLTLYMECGADAPNAAENPTLH